MPSNVMESPEKLFAADEVDLLILEELVRHPGINYKEVAKSLHLDQRTVSKRVGALTKAGVLRRIVEIEWSKLGLQATAYVGSTTARGIDYARRLYELINSDPRVVKAYETLGTYQYLLKVIDIDMFKMRDSVLRDVDVLASDLAPSLVTKKLKEDYGSLLRYLRETKFPRSRAQSDRLS